MKIYRFVEAQCPAVEAGTKRRTIRPARGRAPTVGGASVPDLEAFAQADGYPSLHAMAQFMVGLYGPGEWHGLMIDW